VPPTVREVVENMTHSQVRERLAELMEQHQGRPFEAPVPPWPYCGGCSLAGGILISGILALQRSAYTARRRHTSGSTAREPR
jgi:hypothetical protein